MWTKILKTISVFVVLFLQQVTIIFMSRDSFDNYLSTRLKKVQMNVRQTLSSENIFNIIEGEEPGSGCQFQSQLTIIKSQFRASFEIQITDIYIQYNVKPSTSWSIFQSSNSTTPVQQISHILYQQTEHNQNVFNYKEPQLNLNNEQVIQLVLPISSKNDDYNVQLGISILYNDFIQKQSSIQFSFYFFLAMGVVIIGQLYFIILLNIEKYRIVNEKTNQLKFSKEAMFDSWWEVDKTIKIVDASNNFYQMLGYSKEETIGKYFQEFLTSEENTRVNGGLRLLLTQRTPIRHFRNQRETKDGEIRTYLTTGYPKIAEDGTLIGFICYDYDISNIENIKNKSLLFREQYYQYPQPMILTNYDLTIRYINKQFIDKFKIHQGQIQGQKITDFIQNKSPDSVKQNISDHISTRDYIIEDFQWRDIDGLVHNLQQYISAIKNQQDEIINYFFIFRDMDYNDLLDRETQNIEETMKLLISESCTPMFLIDQETKKIMLSNDFIQNVLGYTNETFSKLFLYDIWDLTIDEVDEWVSNFSVKTETNDCNMDFIHKNRSKIQIKFMQKTIPLFDRECIIFIINKEENNNDSII